MLVNSEPLITDSMLTEYLFWANHCTRPCKGYSPHHHSVHSLVEQMDMETVTLKYIMRSVKGGTNHTWRGQGFYRRFKHDLEGTWKLSISGLGLRSQTQQRVA